MCALQQNKAPLAHRGSDVHCWATLVKKRCNFHNKFKSNLLKNFSQHGYIRRFFRRLCCSDIVYSSCILDSLLT